MKEYFVKVDVKEAPTKADWYFIFTHDVDGSDFYSVEESRWLNSNPTHYLKPVTIDEVENERFKKPTDKQIIEIAMLMSVKNNIVDKKELVNIVATCNFILDRLYENNDIMKPSSKE